MPVHLLFLFLLQSGLAFAFSFFIARILLNGSKAEGRDKLLAAIRIVRKVVAALALILSPALFFAYYNSLPEGQSAVLALWPAVWIFLILAAVVLALTLAIWRPPAQRGNP
jgi:cytochrome bd-type quinol oxidase subunit 2